tara:strand:- start:189 stop:566 length:378 start_codon:yes stop_codon:yes gene_type:complete
MIKRFTDLAANERTYLAWIRTSIALMAFGFLIEKFDLFFRMVGHALHLDVHFHFSSMAEIVGLVMMLISVFVIIGASGRYVHNRKNILAEEEREYGSRILDLILAGLLVISAMFLLIYVWVSVFD